MIAGAWLTVSVNVCVRSGATPFAAVKVSGIRAAGAGGGRAGERGGAVAVVGEGDAGRQRTKVGEGRVGGRRRSTVNVPALPTVKVVVVALAMAGAPLTVSMKFWIAPVPTPLLAEDCQDVQALGPRCRRAAQRAGAVPVVDEGHA